MAARDNESTKSDEVFLLIEAAILVLFLSCN